MRAGTFGFGAAFALLLTVAPAAASPWAEVGDSQMRADLELLETSGVIRDITIAWPLPWASLQAALQRADLSRQPQAVRTAASRLLALAQAFQELFPGSPLPASFFTISKLV